MEPYIKISKSNLRSILPHSLYIDPPDQNSPQGKSTGQPCPCQQISFFLHVLFVLSFSIAHRQFIPAKNTICRYLRLTNASQHCLFQKYVAAFVSMKVTKTHEKGKKRIVTSAIRFVSCPYNKFFSDFSFIQSSIKPNSLFHILCIWSIISLMLTRSVYLIRKGSSCHFLFKSVLYSRFSFSLQIETIYSLTANT